MRTIDKQSPGQSHTPISTILSVALLLRLFMTFFGSRVLDTSKSDLNYTDVDYNIFTDAAQLILEGEASLCILCSARITQTSLMEERATHINALFSLHLKFPSTRSQVNLLMNALHTGILRFWRYW